jgi:hypothetical protein
MVTLATHGSMELCKMYFKLQFIKGSSLQGNTMEFEFYIVVKVFEYIHGYNIYFSILNFTCTYFDNDMVKSY